MLPLQQNLQLKMDCYSKEVDWSYQPQCGWTCLTNYMPVTKGIVKCHVRARESVWWPGIGRKLEDLVNGCSATVQREYGESSFIMSMPNGQLRQGKKHQLPAQRNGNRGPTIFTAAHGESCNSCLWSGEHHNLFWSCGATATETCCWIDQTLSLLSL